MQHRIKAIRKASGLTQTEFSERLGVSKSAVTNWEYGQNEPSKAMLDKMQAVFRINPLYLSGESDIMQIPPDEDEEIIDAALSSGDPLIRALLIGIVKQPDGWRLLAQSILSCADYLHRQGITLDNVSDNSKSQGT